MPLLSLNDIFAAQILLCIMMICCIYNGENDDICSNQINLATLSGGSLSKDVDEHSSSDDESDTDDETVTRDLNSWRTAVNNSTSSAQLSLYVAQLVRCIAWEKSIMKVVSCFDCLAYITGRSFVMLSTA